MPRVRCPRCSTVVETVAGEAPVCPTCGFGAPAPSAAPVAPAPAASAPAATPPTPADPWDQGYGAPTAPAAATPAAGPGNPPGKVRSPGLIVLFYIITLGIYGLVWHYKTGTEVDRFDPSARAGGLLRGYTWTAAAAYAAILISVLMILVAVFAALGDAIAEDREPTEDEVLGAVFGAGFGVVLLVAGMIASLVADVLRYIGMWRVWGNVSEHQGRLGFQPLSPILMLMFLLSPYAANVLQIPLSIIPVLGPLVTGLLGLAATVLTIIAYVQTQSALNQVWRAHGAPDY